MIQTINYPLSRYCIDRDGGWDILGAKIKALGLDGIEAIVDPDDLADECPDALIAGYHMVFYPDWVDFWRQDEKKLLAKFQSWDEIKSVYRGTKPEDLMVQFKEDLAYGIKRHTPYMVFHVSDVSLKESYTYRWLHTNKEVLDAAIEFINELLKGVEPSFDFLIENLWWPGFTFTEPAETEYILSRIDYPRKGIMLDTGHLMSTNTWLQNQKEAIRYILIKIKKHGELAKAIRGMHFHQSLSGAYVWKHTGAVPDDFPVDYFEAFAYNYPHVEAIDRHRPWTEPDCVKIIDAVEPLYLTHELSDGHKLRQLPATKRQLTTIRKGYGK